MIFKNLRLLAIDIILINVFAFINLIELNKVSIAEEISKPSADYIRKKDSYREYILGPGDIIEISVLKDNPANYNGAIDGTYEVDGEGFIDVKRLDRIYIEGLTMIELKNILNEEYKKYIKTPNVKIKINKYRPIKIYVKGEVNFPGLYLLKGSYFPEEIFEIGERETKLSKTIDNEIGSVGNKGRIFPTLYDGIRKSGGLTLESDLKKIEITRKNNLSEGGGFIKTNISLFDLIENSDLTQNIRIYDGDIINVMKSKENMVTQISKAIQSNLNPRVITILVTGRVEDPGMKTLPKLSTLSDALDYAGGIKVIRGPIRYLRIKPDGTLDKRIFKYKKSTARGAYKNPYLQNGDIVIVGKSGLNIANEVITEITDPFLRIYPTFSIIKDISGE